MSSSILLLAAVFRDELCDCSFSAHADEQTVQVGRQFAQICLPICEIETNDIQFAQTFKTAARWTGVVVSDLLT